MKWPHGIYVVKTQSELFSLPHEVGCIAICEDTNSQWLYGKTLGWIKIDEPEYKTETLGCVNNEKRKSLHNCPNCGAPINPHKEKCEYCDTYYYHKPAAQMGEFPPISTAEPLTAWRYDH